MRLVSCGIRQAAGSALLLVFSAAVQADSLGEPGRDLGGPNPLKNVYFGEQHMHTKNSFDAFTIGSGTWDDAYRYAKGEEITLSTTGEKIKKRTPYDFVAITDHAEYFGVLKEFGEEGNPLADLIGSDELTDEQWGAIEHRVRQGQQEHDPHTTPQRPPSHQIVTRHERT